MVEMEKERFKRIPQKKKKKKAFKLDFDCSHLFTKSIETWLVILNSKDQGQKRPQSNKIDLRMFCEKLPLWFTISSES